MSYHPPQWLEFLAKTLVPPVAAEHVLGDITECSGSSRQYIRNLIAVLPGAVWCQLRRRVHPAGVLIDGLLTAAAIASALTFSDNSFLAESPGWVLFAPTAVWVIGKVIAAAYVPERASFRWNRKLLASTFIATLITAWAVGVPLAGAMIGLAVATLVFVALTMPWASTLQSVRPLTLETLPERASGFQKMIWWRNARESSVAIFLVLLQGYSLPGEQNRFDVLGTLTLILGLLFVIYYLHFRANSRPVPVGSLSTILDFHRSEIARQRDLLRKVPLWYLMPLVPGVSIGLASSWTGLTDALGGLIGVGVVFALAWVLNLWGARWLDARLQEVESLQKSV